MAHDPWTFVTIVWPMTHGEKVAEGAREGAFYLVWFAFLCPLSLALGTLPEEQDFSLKITGVLSLAGLAVTGTINFRL